MLNFWSNVQKTTEKMGKELEYKYLVINNSFLE